jgi:hypothetical protein
MPGRSAPGEKGLATLHPQFLRNDPSLAAVGAPRLDHRRRRHPVAHQALGSTDWPRSPKVYITQSSQDHWTPTFG